MESSESMREKANEFYNQREFAKAFELYSQCSAEGDKLSQCRMGEMYYSGQWVDKRPIKAFDLIKGSFDPDIPETVYQLGKCYFEGIGTEANQELGFEMIITVAEIGHPAAENYIAALYLEGEYVEKNVDKGLSWLEKAVAHEDPKALYNMGNFLFDGRHVSMNAYKAVTMWKKSSDLYYSFATGRLGDAYLRGKGADKNVEKGLDFLEKAAVMGDGMAAEQLADYYVQNSGGKEDIDKATRFYNIALENGNKKVYYDLGMIHRYKSEERDSKKACEYFRKGHEEGDYSCSFEYAIMKSRGVGTKSDDEVAFKIFLKGAEKGYIRFMGWVGHCYYYGIGVNPDRYTAREWFERGCEKDDAYCTYRLAEFYFRGITVDVDQKYALTLLRKAFRDGNIESAYRLATLYENNHDVKSIPDALYWYMAGANKNNPDCMMKLASHYESGVFIQKSEKKAFDLYQKAYKIDDSPITAAEIGRCFEEGIGTDVDIKTAVSWYLKAARRNAFAMWRLYNIYMERNETDRAVFWLRRSASKGSVSAMVELAKIYEEGKLVPKSDFKAMCWYHKASDEGNEHAKSRFEELIRFDPQDPEDIGDYERATRILGEEGDDKHIIDLAEELTEGNDFPMDLPKAKMWYEIASQLGVHGAKDGLKKIESMLKGEKQISDKQTTLKVME